MLAYTLSQKSSASPLATLSAACMKQLLAARPESISLVLHRWKSEFKRTLGKTPRLHHEQTQKLAEHAGAINGGAWTSKYSALPLDLYRIQDCFTTGFIADMSIPDKSALLVAERFYDMLDMAWTAPQSSSRP